MRGERCIRVILSLTVFFGDVSGGTFWVAPSIEECKDHSPCDTLLQYQNNNSLVFSNSHTTWIFLGGEHLLVGGDIVITDATNITLKGENCLYGTNETCSVSPRIISRPSCSAQVCQEKHTGVTSYCLYSWSSYVSYGIVVIRSADVTVKGVEFDVQSAPLYCPSVGFNESVFFSSNDSPVNGVRFFLVHNVILHSVSFQDMRESRVSHQVTFIIQNPSGQYNVTEFATNFEVDIIIGEKYRQQDSLNIRPTTSIAPLDPTLQFSVLDSTFINNSVSLVIRDPFDIWYSVVDIVLRYCSFTTSNVSVDTDIAFVNLDLSVNFYNCTWSTVGAWMGSLSLNVDQAGLLHSCDLSFVTIALDQCLIMGSRTYVNFRNWIGDTNWLFMDELHNTTTPVDGLEQSRIVTVSDSTFHDSIIECDAHYPSAEYVGTPWCEDILLLTFANITFVRNTTQSNYFYNTASFQIRGFDMFPVVFEGVNTIEDSSGFYLRNSRLYIYNTINITSDFSGMILTYDSFLYLSNNSQLFVDHITVVPHPLVYNDFVRCAVHRQKVENVPTCHSYCFFQPLLDPETNASKGNFSDRNVNSTHNNRSHNNVALFNMKLYVRKNSNPDAWNEPIFNGHLENCTLKFGSEDVPLTRALLDQFVVLQGEYDNQGNTPYLFSSPPYHICICDLNRPNDSNYWICDNNTQVEYNLVQKVRQGLVLMGDFHRIKRSFVRVRIDSNDTNLDELRLFSNSSSCTEITTSVNNLTPNQKYNLTILAYSAVQNILGLYFTSLIFTIQIQVQGKCPPGMVLSNDACVCHPLLARNNIECSISGTDAFFKTPSSSYWIDIRGDEVLVSSNCPPFYCSNLLSTERVSLSNLSNNSGFVCNAANHRQGTLCSVCEPGLSSMFGSYKCDICRHQDVILPVILLSLAGIGVVAVLFLLNCTVMQGSIIGTSFYLHALHALSELLQLKNNTDIFQRALSILGLSLGIGTCFYSGMDEYARGFLGFIFPLYLFTLVIIIIICAHKFNLRIFRVQFIAKRSVPVLATLMLLTYDGLIQAVAFGLYFARIRSSTESSTESSTQLVWLFQADLPFFRGKHLALGLICILVLLFYLLPLTIVLIFGDLFRMCSRSLWFSHFLDVFHGALRYPFGFWLGVRFLLRAVIITLSSFRTVSKVSLGISAIVGILLLLQLFIRPYRVDNLPEHALQDTRVRMTFKKALKWRIARLFLPSVVDSMFLGHIIIIAVIFASRESLDEKLADAASSIALLLATIHIIMVACFHIYMYFPFPARTGEWMERFREKLASRFRLLKSRMQRGRNSVMLVDTTSSPISISYLSASMAMRGGDYTSSEDSSGDESSAGEGDRQPICPQTETQA